MTPRADPAVTIVVPGRWHAFELARGLEQSGALHRLVTNYPRSRTRRWDIADDKVVSLPLTLLLTKLAWRAGGDRLATRLQFRINALFANKAARCLGSPTVLHAWSGSAEPSMRVARRSGLMTILERSSSHMVEQCRILEEAYRAIGRVWTPTPPETVERELREYELADEIFVPSRFVYRTFIERGFPAERLFRNGFGVDISRFSAAEGEGSPVFRVVFAGSLTVRKGVHHLVEAFRRANLPGSELLLVGGRSDETAQLLGPDDPRVRTVGHVPQAELVEHYRTASVFAIASLEEGQAMVQAQALACGLPLVCTDSTGGEDLLAQQGEGVAAEGMREYPAGIVVPTSAPEALAHSLRRLHGSPAKRAAMRRAAVALAARDLSWERYARANLEEYRRLAAARREREDPEP